MLGQRTLKLAQLARPPNFRYILFVVQRLDGTRNVATDTALVVPERTPLIKQVKPIVGEEIGRVGQVVEDRLDVVVESVEGDVRYAGVVDDALRGNL